MRTPPRPAIAAVLLTLCGAAHAAKIGDVRVEGLDEDMTTNVVVALSLEDARLSPTPQLIAALAVTSLIGTAFAFYVLNAVQAWTTPTRAAIIFAAEPVFAALTSWVVEGEVLKGPALLGAALILAGILIAEIAPSGHVPGEARP